VDGHNAHAEALCQLIYSRVPGMAHDIEDFGPADIYGARHDCTFTFFTISVNFNIQSVIYNMRLLNSC
jgi:hypothetical protein